MELFQDRKNLATFGKNLATFAQTFLAALPGTKVGRSRLFGLCFGVRSRRPILTLRVRSSVQTKSNFEGRLRIERSIPNQRFVKYEANFATKLGCFITEFFCFYPIN